MDMVFRHFSVCAGGTGRMFLCVHVVGKHWVAPQKVMRQDLPVRLHAKQAASREQLSLLRILDRHPQNLRSLKSKPQTRNLKSYILRAAVNSTSTGCQASGHR